MQALARTWTPPGGTLGQLLSEAQKRAEAAEADRSTLERRARSTRRGASFRAALLRPTVAVIAELKRGSPSRGLIDASIDAAAQTASYAAGGAAALSILTEPAHFHGCLQDLADARATNLPLLRKDFLVRPLQLLEARAYGASAVLLIARALAPLVLLELASAARELELETLIEVRDERELDLALDARADVIGVNNRDLESMAIDDRVSARLLPLVPATVPAVYESGVASVDDVERAAGFGADAVLVGSSVSAAADATAAVRALAGVRRRAGVGPRA